MKEMSLTQRRSRALKAASNAGADALLLTHGADLRYLSGFTGSAGALAVVRGRSRLFTDGRYREQAKAEVDGVAVSIESRSAVLAAVDWLVAHKVVRCAFDAVHTTVAQLEAMRRQLPGPKRRSFFLATQGIVSTLREIKDADEIGRMRRAAALGCALFDGVLHEISAGVPEMRVAAWLEQEARRRGAEAMSFETIVASGERSALPHGRASAARIPRKGFVTLDFGVILDGYCSDMTRTVHMGRPGIEARSVYDSVLEAQLAAIDAVRSGVESGTVDEAARSCLQRAGLDQEFVHSTGHGVGLEIHEGPRLAARQKARLQTGMVVTIEPGVYRTGRFGVRIEDMVLVTQTGCEIMTPSPKTLIEL